MNPLAEKEGNQVALTLTIIVHGTWANDETWWQWGFEFPTYIDQETKDVYKGGEPFKWRGGNNHKDRKEGGEALLGWVQRHPAEKLRVLAHSHGGNVLFFASQLGLSIHTLILMGTPIRTDYLPDMMNIRNIYNVYSPDDSVQPIGAEFYPRGEGENKARVLPEASENLKVQGGHADLHTSSLWKKHKLERILGTMSVLPTEQELILRAQRGDRPSRLTAILDLARMRSMSALPMLREMLENDEPPVQIYAAYALYHIAGDKEGLPILLRYLLAPYKDLREAAAYALGLMGKGILPELNDALVREPTSSSIQRVISDISSE